MSFGHLNLISSLRFDLSNSQINSLELDILKQSLRICFHGDFLIIQHIGSFGQFSGGRSALKNGKVPQLELDPIDNVKSGKEFFLIFKNLTSMPHSNCNNIKKALFVNI
jgi:hypothetical protein